MLEIYSSFYYNRGMETKKQSLKVHVSFDRRHLFEFVKHGFVASKIGSLWCEGWIMADRLAAIDVAYEIL